MAKSESNSKGRYPARNVPMHERNEQIRADKDLSKLPSAGKHCYVYIIRASRFAMKVGIARDLRRRIDTLQSGNHVALTLMWAYRFENRKVAMEAERAAHALLKPHRLQGEWFYLRPREAKKAIEGYCATYRIKHKRVTKWGVVEATLEETQERLDLEQLAQLQAHGLF